jgi:PH (Pleckstrin Homology) domain-containing protein
MTLDGRQRARTALAGALVGFVFVSVLATRVGIGALGVCFVAIVLALSWAMAPCAVVVDSAELRILRRAWTPLRLPLPTVASALPIDSLDRGTLRLFGVGGFFGSYGLFRNATIGRFRLYATRGGPAVLVRLKGGGLPIVLTPDDVPGTIEAIGPRA